MSETKSKVNAEIVDRVKYRLYEIVGKNLEFIKCNKTEIEFISYSVPYTNSRIIALLVHELKKMGYVLTCWDYYPKNYLKGNKNQLWVYSKIE